VLAAIQFGDKPSLMAYKIDDKRSNRRLPSEAQSIESVRTQGEPKPFLRIRHLMT
jgi:hypothetical protein